MPKIDQLITNFAVYEDATEYLGMSEATLPEVVNLTEEITGAGIAGNIEAVILGHIEAMTLTLNFRTVTPAAIKLAEPRVHKIDLRAAQQEHNTRTGVTSVNAAKHILKVTPKKYAPENWLRLLLRKQVENMPFLIMLFILMGKRKWRLTR